MRQVRAFERLGAAIATGLAILVFLSPTQLAQAGALSFYNTSSGAFDFTSDPTFNGGDFNGRTFSSLYASEVAGVRDGVQLALFGPAGLSFYDRVTGNLGSVNNPTLAGGEFNGQSLSDLSTSIIVGVRDSGGSQLGLFGPTGLSFYDVVSGTLAFVNNPTLSGGEFTGMTLNSIPSSKIVGIRDMGAQIAIHGAAGISFYDRDTGALASAHNVTLTGGPFNGLTPSSLPSHYIAGLRDGAGPLALFVPVPEPASIALMGLGMVAVVSYASRCLRRRKA